MPDRDDHARLPEPRHTVHALEEALQEALATNREQEKTIRHLAAERQLVMTMIRALQKAGVIDDLLSHLSEDSRGLRVFIEDLSRLIEAPEPPEAP